MLKEEAFDICEKLLSKQAHFYVCGDVKMADDVCKTLQVIWNTRLFEVLSGLIDSVSSMWLHCDRIAKHCIKCLSVKEIQNKRVG